MTNTLKEEFEKADTHLRQITGLQRVISARDQWSRIQAISLLMETDQKDSKYNIDKMETEKLTHGDAGIKIKFTVEQMNEHLEAFKKATVIGMLPYMMRMSDEQKSYIRHGLESLCYSIERAKYITTGEIMPEPIDLSESLVYVRKTLGELPDEDDDSITDLEQWATQLQNLIATTEEGEEVLPIKKQKINLENE